uniref:LAGLIDADG endonuclease n=1 Tax=Pyronema omphalodes TaxID=337075 RepID=A0A140IMV1_9PEZI|nr:LAGLIDADG endonuclease [Pyronema omphalodes]AMO66509.1 LAGLIDADG endonuclease [Pyronema omphalodes]
MISTSDLFIDFSITSLGVALKKKSPAKVVSDISIHGLEKGKIFVYHPDKKTVAFVFDNCGQAARCLTPQRCMHFSDSELQKNKNLQHILRVINKGVLTLTEKGKFYFYKNPEHSTCLALVPWGVNLPSGVTNKLISKQERDMVRIPSYQYGVIIGLLLSDAWLQLQTKQRSINSHLGFKQALVKSKYVWFVFTILCHYCSSYPFLVTGVRSGVRYFGRPPPFFTRALPCFTELHSLFYVDSIKVQAEPTHKTFMNYWPLWLIVIELWVTGFNDLMDYNFALTLILYLM